MENEDRKNNNSLDGCLILLVFLITSLLINGYVTTFLWNGLISPTFSMNELNFWQGFGLYLFVRYLVFNVKQREPEQTDGQRFLTGILTPTMYWLIGFILMKWFM